MRRISAHSQGCEFDALKKEIDAYQPIPEVRRVTPDMIQRNYEQVKQDVRDLVRSEMEALLNNPARVHLIINRK